MTNLLKLKLYDHQKEVIDKLSSGSILCGGVGTGKSLTALSYFFLKEGHGELPINGYGEFKPMTSPKDLYIITTARKRDMLEWDAELPYFLMSTNKEINYYKNKIIVDSWNNIGKYIDAENAFFIFDEQRLVGYGSWVQSFIKITKKNNWILLTATPGDSWIEYAPVFIANGFYKNKTEFVKRHVVYKRFSKYPQIEKYIDTGILIRYKNKILINMDYEKKTIRHKKIIKLPYNHELYKKIAIDRWDIYDNQPVQDMAKLCYLMRKLVNSDNSRLEYVKELAKQNNKIIIFYNYNYELEILRSLKKDFNVAEWNGHLHQEIPNTDNWIYLVQYTAGAEGWNCVDTNVIVFYSQNYSYKITEQASGRIDRINTNYKDLYYYHLTSDSIIDKAISNALNKKKNFNEQNFLKIENYAHDKYIRHV